MALGSLNVLRDISAGERIGTGLGAGLGQKLQQLAEQKIADVVRQKEFQRNYGALQQAGFGPEEASFIARFPQEQQVKLLSSLWDRGGAPLQSVPLEMQESPLLAMDSSGLGALKQVLPEGIKAQPSEMLPEKQAISQQLAVQKPTIADIMRRPPARERREEEKLDIAKQKLALQKEQFEKKISAKEQENIDKETLPEYKEIVKNAKAAKDNERRLNRMEQLNEKGDLNFGAFSSVLKGLGEHFGIDVSSLMTADEQEFDKLSADFIKNAKDVFGARITDADLRAFLKTVPTLSQSKEGRRRVIKSLRVGNAAAKAKKDAMDEIIKENNGKRPRNLELLVEERVNPILDELAQEYIASPIGLSEEEKKMEYNRPKMEGESWFEYLTRPYY